MSAVFRLTRAAHVTRVLATAGLSIAPVAADARQRLFVARALDVVVHALALVASVGASGV